jgi:hypothetical protein
MKTFNFTVWLVNQGKSITAGENKDGDCRDVD